MKSFSTLLLWDIFHAKACSRPPLPNSNIFILNKILFRLIPCKVNIFAALILMLIYKALIIMFF